MANLARRDSVGPEVGWLASRLGGPYQLDGFLRSVWSILPDPPEAEYVRAPSWIIQCECFEGDCDDAATLASSVLRALGVPAWLVAVRMATEPEFSHVFCHVPGLGLDIDPIVPAHLLPIRYAEAMILEV